MKSSPLPEPADAIELGQPRAETRRRVWDHAWDWPDYALEVAWAILTFAKR